VIECILVCTTSFAALAQPSDEAAVRAAFDHYDHGWRTNNAAEILSTIAPNCEWVNSVGVRITDKATFRRFLDHIFKDADFRAGTSGVLTIHSIKLLSPETAVVTSSEPTTNQKDSATGKTVPVLHTNELTVMQKIGGQWLIVNDLTSDESHGI
jgi:uncharacterized protein (TIGR02246 family)